MQLSVYDMVMCMYGDVTLCVYVNRTGVSPWGGMLPDRSSLVVDAIRQHQTLHIPPAAPSPASEADRDTPHPHTCDSSSAASRNEEIDDALLD